MKEKTSCVSKLEALKYKIDKKMFQLDEYAHTQGLCLEHQHRKVKHAKLRKKLA
jgi:hypothetical protein